MFGLCACAMLVFPWSKQQNRVRTTSSTLLGTLPNCTRTKGREQEISPKFSCVKFFWNPLGWCTSASSGEERPRKKLYFPVLRAMGWKFLAGTSAWISARTSALISRPKTFPLGRFSLPERDSPRKCLELDIFETPVAVTPQQKMSKTSNSFQNSLKILKVYFSGRWRLLLGK